jgi:hypothetical protein
MLISLSFSTGHVPPAHLIGQGPSDEELERTFVYVVGGRERGHTLGICMNVKMRVVDACCVHKCGHF